MNNYERVDLLIDFTTFASQHLYLWNTAEAPFGNASPITANPVAELTAFLANPISVIGNEIDRRPYPQIMRFDIKTKAGSSLDTLPVDPLWTQPRPPLDLKADMPIRLMALIDNQKFTKAKFHSGMLPRGKAIAHDNVAVITTP